MYKSIFSLFCNKISFHFWTYLVSVRHPYMAAHWAVSARWTNEHIQQPLCWRSKGAPLPYYVFYASPDITWHAPLVCWPMLASEILPNSRFLPTSDKLTGCNKNQSPQVATSSVSYLLFTHSDHFRSTSTIFRPRRWPQFVVTRGHIIPELLGSIFAVRRSPQLLVSGDQKFYDTQVHATAGIDGHTTCKSRLRPEWMATLHISMSNY